MDEMQRLGNVFKIMQLVSSRQGIKPGSLTPWMKQVEETEKRYCGEENNLSKHMESKESLQKLARFEGAEVQSGDFGEGGANRGRGPGLMLLQLPGPPPMSSILSL